MSRLKDFFKSGWPRDLLMTFLGTTISIILTFGTAHIVNKNQARADGRQTALRVIHDMDNTIKDFKTFAKLEEDNFKMAQKIMVYRGDLSDFTRDTLSSVLDFLVSSPFNRLSADDATEKTFLSDENAWKNIDNPNFIDAVQTFYYTRRVYFDYFRSAFIWKSPLTDKDIYEHTEDGGYFEVNYAKYLKDLITQKSVRYYIANSPARQRVYYRIADSFTAISNKCKFLLGITDEELKQYVKNIERHGNPLKHNNLLGTWLLTSADNEEDYYEFHDDNTLARKRVYLVTDAHYSGRIAINQEFEGKWTLDGDSLHLIFQPTFTYNFDTTQISYRPEMKKDILYLLDSWENTYAKALEKVKGNGEVKVSYAASIDASGKKIELRDKEIGENGEPEDSYTYISLKER